jgi:hypothetical protein
MYWRGDLNITDQLFQRDLEECEDYALRTPLIATQVQSVFPTVPAKESEYLAADSSYSTNPFRIGLRKCMAEKGYEFVDYNTAMRSIKDGETLFWSFRSIEGIKGGRRSK